MLTVWRSNLRERRVVEDGFWRSVVLVLTAYYLGPVSARNNRLTDAAGLILPPDRLRHRLASSSLRETNTSRVSWTFMLLRIWIAA